MKKGLVLLAATSLFVASPVLAQTSNDYAESASRKLYSFDGYHALELVKYFRELHEKGLKFPSDADFQEKFGVNVELVRSHVRKRNVLTGEKNRGRLFPNLREGRTVFMNLPTGTEKTTGGFPSGQFDNDIYTLWQYVDLYGAWNHGFFQAPGSWADAAHKHGVDMMSGIVFFDTTGNVGGEGSESYVSEIMKKDNAGNYLYTKPLIHLLMYLGLDGINYNWEATGYTTTNVVNFHKELRNYAKELKFDNYRQAIYTSRQSLEQDYADAWLWDKSKQHHIGDIMLNYASGDFADRQGYSGNVAKSITGSYDHLYSGAWIVTMQRSWQSMESSGNNNNLCLWGEHANSRFVSNNSGDTSAEKMKNLQYLFERAFSGGSRNPGIKDNWGIANWDNQLQGFGGISRMIPERTTLEQNLPFRTYFNTGAGERYFYKGKTASLGGWYNMASQDLQPTYRWLQYELGTTTAKDNVQVEYVYDDAYMGGTSLHVFGEGGVDVILYRGLLTVGEGNVKATLAFKAVEESKKNPVSLLLHKQGAAAGEYVEVPFSDLSGTAWEEQTVDVSGLAKGDIIDFVGIRVANNPNTNLYLGEIAIFDDRLDPTAPLAPTNLQAEVKEETQSDLAVMLSWNAQLLPGKSQTRADHALLYNDEAGVHHFEILYKEGKNGTVRELGRTTSWTTYVPRVAFAKPGEDSESLYFGVRAVGEDLKSISEITWIEVNRQESTDVPVANRYCTSELNPTAEGAATARRIRYLERVKTTGAKVDLNYTANSPDVDGDNYVYHSKSGFTVMQGQQISFNFKAHNEHDGLRYCWAQTYIDWNNDGVFDAQTDEKIQELQLGTARKATNEFQSESGVTKNFTVPSDATPGTVRVRIVFTDAWFPLPTPCGVTAKGFTFDFDMKIEGDNPARPSIDKHDAGEPEEPQKLNGANTLAVESIAEVSELPSFYPNPVESKLYVQNADYAWIYTIDGRLVKSFNATVATDLSELAGGTYVIKLRQNGVIRSYKLIKK